MKSQFNEWPREVLIYRWTLTGLLESNMSRCVNNYNAKESKKKLQFPLSANNETRSVSNARRFAQQKYHRYILEVHSTPTSQVNLHNSDSAICNGRPVDRADENAAGDKRTQLWDDSVGHIHHVDQRTYE